MFKTILSIICSSLLFLSCQQPDRQDLNYVNTYELDGGIYYEKYEDNNEGVYAGESYYYYLTDSSLFRKYIGYCKEGEWITVESGENGIYSSSKYSSWSGKQKNSELIEAKKYNISELRNSKVSD